MLSLVAGAQSLMRHYDVKLDIRLGVVSLDVPMRYDTLHHWPRGGCTGYDHVQLYRIQYSMYGMYEERGDWLGRLGDSIDDVTIVHATTLGRHKCDSMPLYPKLFTFLDTLGLVMVSGEDVKFMFTTNYSRGADTIGKLPRGMQAGNTHKRKKLPLPEVKWYQQSGLFSLCIKNERVTVEICRRSPSGLKKDFITECMKIIDTLEIRRL